MEYAFSDIRNICEHLTLFGENIYKARIENGIYFVYENGKILFQSSSLKELRESIMLYQRELKNKGLC